MNKAIKREHHTIPTLQDIVTEFTGKTVFSTLDLKDGYWQIQLDEESSQLCTFSSPFGRYRFTRMPFGIRSASEVFQKKNEAAFSGIPGVHIVADDIIIAADSIQEHDKILTQVLERAKERNIVFNLEKLQLRVNKVKYLGTIVTPDGTKPDPSKVKAIVEMDPPQDKAGIRRLLGMLNFLAAHIPNMSDITGPLRCLLKSDVHFNWGPEQEAALAKMKATLSSAPVLHYFDPSIVSTIQADASQSGLGACLFQKGKPIAYASRSLSPSECNYPQIEKELLAIVFACSKFHQYIYGFHTKVQSDHKPLESIMVKPLHKVSPRLQRMLLKLQKYDLEVKYTKGKELYVADTLSRAYLTIPPTDNDIEDLEFAVHALVRDLPVSDAKLSQLQSATEHDEQLQKLHHYISSGWPTNISNVPIALRSFWKLRHELHSANKLVLLNSRFVIPISMRSFLLKCIHQGHMGIEKSKARARACVYWPNMYSDIESTVKQCSVCNKYSNANQKEPLLPHPVPTRPWEKVGVDYFTLDGKDFLLVVDYFSKFPEVLQVTSKTAQATIAKLKIIFARHSIPQVVMADNMPFSSKEFKVFAKSWDFHLVTSSPTYPQSNGLVQRNVQSMKRLFQKARDVGTDEELALLEFRNTPITGLNESPTQLLMSRRLRSVLPMTSTLLQPSVVEGIKEKLEQRQQRQKGTYDKRAKPLPRLHPNETVRYRMGKTWRQATVVSEHSSPRSYRIQTPQGTIMRRNRCHLRQVKEPFAPSDDIDDYFDDDFISSTASHAPGPDDTPAPEEPIQLGERRSRYGRVIRPPIRYRDD